MGVSTSVIGRVTECWSNIKEMLKAERRKDLNDWLMAQPLTERVDELVRAAAE